MCLRTYMLFMQTKHVCSLWQSKSRHGLGFISSPDGVASVADWIVYCTPIIHRENSSEELLEHYMTEGSLEAKLPTIWRDEKASSAEA